MYPNAELNRPVLLAGTMASVANVIQCDYPRTALFASSDALGITPAACCVLMALLACGELSWSDIPTQLRFDKPKHHQRLWVWLTRDYIVGADAGDLRHLVSLITSRVRCAFSDAKGKDAERFIWRGLHSRHRVVVGLQHRSLEFDHWALVTACVLNEAQGVERFLLLDPKLECPKEHPWNSAFQPPFRSLHGRYVDSRGRGVAARLSGALSIERRGSNEFR